MVLAVGQSLSQILKLMFVLTCFKRSRIEAWYGLRRFGKHIGNRPIICREIGGRRFLMPFGCCSVVFRAINDGDFSFLRSKSDICVVLR